MTRPAGAGRARPRASPRTAGACAGRSGPGVTEPPAASTRANRPSGRPSASSDASTAARGPTATMPALPARRRPARRADTGSSAVKPGDLALRRAAANAAGHRDDLAGPDDEQARRRLAGPAALDDAERPAAHAGLGRRPAPRGRASRPPRAAARGLHRREVAQPEVVGGGSEPGARSAASAGAVRVIGDGQERGQWGEPDQLRFGGLDAVLGGERRGPSSQTSHSGVTAKSSRFIETWARRGWPRSGSRISKPFAWTCGQAAARFADAPGDALGQLDVVRVEVDVVGDEERPSADRDRAGRRVELRPGRNRARGRAGRSPPSAPRTGRAGRRRASRDPIAGAARA